MFYISEMFFEVQTLIFVQLFWHFPQYSFHDNCHKELARILIHIRKIFKSIFQNAAVSVAHNCWEQALNKLWPSNFWNGTFEKLS